MLQEHQNNTQKMNQSSYFIKSLTGKYNWMKLNASVIAWMYFYKWLCIDREKLLCLDTLQGVRKYVRERFKIEKSKRKMSETTFKYILLFARMFQVMDSRLMIVNTSFGLGIEATAPLESGKLCCTGFVIGVGNTTKNFVHPSTITIDGEIYYLMGPLALINHSCLSSNTFSQENQFSSISRSKSTELFAGFDDKFKETVVKCRYIYLKLNDPVDSGEVMVNYSPKDLNKLKPFKRVFKDLGFICECSRCSSLEQHQSVTPTHQ